MQEIGISLASASPDEWKKVHFQCDALVDTANVKFGVVRPGDSRDRTRPSMDVSKKMRELRNGMYSQGKGTWLTDHHIATRPGKYSIDYGTEPDFTIPPVAGSRKLDLQYFPRDDEHIPDWLRRKLQEEKNE
ncbi:hypothetical protein EV190_103192 [Actinorugispora endophytica]|uniref:Uncharacterized protein n=1 Tax=Actinorugispora endophytica TaxID=1605990 RepID=A0A4R6V177_9ACTN|nr:hypothetical protein EV190_103192 [Actinorugispora endophytica]